MRRGRPGRSRRCRRRRRKRPSCRPWEVSLRWWFATPMLAAGRSRAIGRRTDPMRTSADAPSGAARLRDGGSSLLNGGGLGGAVARDLVRELVLGVEHASGGVGVGLRADEALERRAGAGERV